MAKPHGRSICALCMALHGCVLLASCAHAQQRWSGSIGAATDYVYRGVTQTHGEPAVQGGVQMQRDGWSVGLWGSTVDLDRDGAEGYELDVNIAHTWVWGSQWIATLGLTHYEYLQDGRLLDYDYDELSASLSFQQRITATISWSPNTDRFRHGMMEGDAAAYELTVMQPLSRRWSLFAGAGYYDLTKLIDDGYAYWSAGLTFVWGSLQIDAAHIDAEAMAADPYGYHANRGRWTGALSIRF